MDLLTGVGKEQAFVCPRCGGRDHVVWGPPSLGYLFWVLNPGLAVNELVFGQRVPRTMCVCRTCPDGGQHPYVLCPRCGTAHHANLWSAGYSSGHWLGLLCPDCGARLPTVRNVTAAAILVLLWPGRRLVWHFAADRFLAWERRRAREAKRRFRADEVRQRAVAAHALESPLYLGPPSPVWRWFRWLPVRRADQLVFATVVPQALEAGVEISTALALAARVTPGPRFRAALVTMRQDVRAGHPLAASLARTGAKVDARLLAALEVGEEHGCVAGELTAFARQLHPRPTAWLNRRLGRPEESVRFAAALARLLTDRRLTPALIEDAGRVAAGGRRAFLAVIAQVAAAVSDGETFPSALRPHRRWFDPLFCYLLDAADTRDGLRATLARLGDEDA